MLATPIDFPVELLRKYTQSGPRYTSYPTAPHFQTELDQPALLQDMRAAEKHSSRSLSLYVHLPFCRSNCWFCGCTKIITRNSAAADRYLDYIEKEIQLLQPHLAPDHRVHQLHLGGGTPTFLSPQQFKRLGDMLHDAFSFHPECESGVEIDPRYLKPEQVSILRELGFNRASLGIQDHNPEVQAAINRIQPLEMTRQAVNLLRDQGFSSINFDLIYGLPHQTPENFARTVEDVLSLKPDRLALFGYAHVPWIVPAQKIFDRRNNLPGSEARLELLQQTVIQVAASGYHYIGMDHFALPADELAIAQRAGTLQRNFQGYSTCAGTDICALGMSAISQTPNAYRQNEKDLNAYYAALDENRLPVARGRFLTHDDRIRRHTIMSLMCHFELPYEKLSRELQIDFPSYFEAEIKNLSPFQDEGLVHLQPDRITVTPAGRFLIRNIAMQFDAYLEKLNARYSKTI